MSQRKPQIVTLAALLLGALAGRALAHDANGIAADAGGRLYVVDAEDGQVWRIARDGTVSVHLEASRVRALNHPHHLAFDASNALWLASG